MSNVLYYFLKNNKSGTTLVEYVMMIFGIAALIWIATISDSLS